MSVIVVKEELTQKDNNLRCTITQQTTTTTATLAPGDHVCVGEKRKADASTTTSNAISSTISDTSSDVKQIETGKNSESHKVARNTAAADAASLIHLSDKVQTATSDETHLVLHKEQLAVGKQEVESGEVDVHKFVKEELVQKVVPVKHDEVVIERRPLIGVAESNAEIKVEDEIVRIPLHREQIVTQKRIIPTEEIIIRKKSVTEKQIVSDILRSEDIEAAKVEAPQVEPQETLPHEEHLSVGQKIKAALGLESKV